LSIGSGDAKCCTWGWNKADLTLILTCGAVAGEEGSPTLSTSTEDLLVVTNQIYRSAGESKLGISLGTLADGYLSKPFGFVRMLARVGQLLGETE
jgi:hypothetical protein